MDEIQKQINEMLNKTSYTEADLEFIEEHALEWLTHQQSIISQQSEQIKQLEKRHEDQLSRNLDAVEKVAKQSAEIERLKREYDELAEQADIWRQESGN